jgi:hypothetical protein
MCTHYEATPIHPLDHYNGTYWERDRPIKTVKHLMPRWDDNYDEFENYNQVVEAFCGTKERYPYS